MDLVAWGFWLSLAQVVGLLVLGLLVLEVDTHIQRCRCGYKSLPERYLQRAPVVIVSLFLSPLACAIVLWAQISYLLHGKRCLVYQILRMEVKS